MCPAIRDHNSGSIRTPIFGQDANVLAEPVGFNGHVVLQRLGDLVQHGGHVEV